MQSPDIIFFCFCFCFVFVDGSASRDPNTGQRRAGYAVIELTGGNSYVVKESSLLPPHCSAQMAEMIALQRACFFFCVFLGEGKKVNIYSDSAYACGVVCCWAGMWAARGYLTAAGTPIKHASLVKELLRVMRLPTELAIIKCAAHTKDTDIASMGNRHADLAAKAAAERSFVSVLHICPVIDTSDVPSSDLMEAQKAVSPTESAFWAQRGCKTRPRQWFLETGKYRQGGGSKQFNS